MIGRMRLTRARSAFVVLLAVLHLGGGVLAAFAPCCDDMAASGALMECCLNGGPDHVCPHMARRASESSSSSDRVAASCAAGHDDGVPVMGFGGLPPDEATVVLPERVATPIAAFEGSALVRLVHPPSPPPRF